MFAVGADQRPAQPRHVGRQRARYGGRSPHPVDEPLGRDRPAHVDEQRAEDAAPPRVAGVEQAPVEAMLDVAEQPELHNPSAPHRRYTASCGTRG
jgi:hypothetical protein